MEGKKKFDERGGGRSFFFSPCDRERNFFRSLLFLSLDSRSPNTSATGSNERTNARGEGEADEEGERLGDAKGEDHFVFCFLFALVEFLCRAASLFFAEQSFNQTLNCKLEVSHFRALPST